MHVVPHLKAPEQKPLEAIKARQLGGVAADRGVGVLPVKDMGGSIVVDLAARGLHEQVGPPVVRRHFHLPCFFKERLGLLVEDHGVAAGDRLHERVAEGPRIDEHRREADRL